MGADNFGSTSRPTPKLVPKSKIEQVEENLVGQVLVTGLLSEEAIRQQKDTYLTEKR